MIVLGRVSVVLLVSGLLIVGLLSGCYTAYGPSERPISRSLWVSRYEHKSRADIDRIMRRAAAAGFQSVMFQVRGNGTTHYSSRREIWSERYGFRAPGFDPLSYAVLAAHRNRLELHAWINAFTGWQGAKPPAHHAQLFRSKPDWFLRTATGEYPREGGGYYFLNPCLPEVRAHVEQICMEVAEGYQVDGIHLDYVRFPDHKPSNLAPGDARSLSIYTKRMRRPRSDHKAFAMWKADCVTRFVRRVRDRLNRLPRRVFLTAAVNANMNKIHRHLLQDWPRWAREGLVDAVFPMNYTHDHSIFDERARACVAAAAGTPVIMGVGSYMHERQGPRATVHQMNAAVRAGAAGVCLFSYGSATKGEWQAAMIHWNNHWR